uniref:Uncharacterized protein n=1 Tax=Chromera velia CCMP2878 TaxID=1169474 RepID=A0A0G4F5P5_9ALVE|eukprot:Cvel_15290.t1-p1 / transcript=Cvel_15290.t1 / gene=Cvel_15290 / organism=Chromera_velia_CCMP2878 / gene_product=Transmembrane protein 151B, putative / transcript_product=Transmembrane protein 151B, putative / location=Cvel_scaffold1122:12503-16692(-) / protein_length=282 / sequence_SO=supercontig / SO=protein_coding / is_pseudo=false
MRGNKITFAEGEGGAQLTQKKRRFKSANDWHAFCLFLSLATVLVFCCLIVSESPSMGVALVLAYTLYLLECFWLSPVARNLWKVKNQVTATELIKRLKQAAPALYFRVQSYHYELKNVTVKEGGEEKVHQIKQRVNTFNDTIQFRYGNWSDESDTVIGLENFGVVSLNLKKALHYLDRETEDQIRDQFEELQQSNRDRDDQMDSEMWTSIAGYLDAPVLCYVSDKQPFWMNWWFYALCSVLLFAWPYRIFFEATTGELTYTVRKCITVSQSPTPVVTVSICV